MRILLIDFNSKIPNLALMKLSTWHKANGDEVFLNHCSRPDKVYISTLFTWDRPRVEKLLEIYPDAEVGGSGWDIEKKLPDQIEESAPDYDLYTVEDIYGKIKGGIGTRESKIAKARTIVEAGIGYTTRGCVNSCGFCVIPIKEKYLHNVGEIKDLINPKSKTIILLDNNLTADPRCEEKLSEIKERGLTVDCTQGIDIRKLTDSKARALSTVKHLRSLHYSWDMQESEPQILRGIELLSQYIKPWKQMCYMLTGYTTSWDQDYYRFSRLCELGISPYVMPYNLTYPTEKHHHFARWVNGRIYKACKFEDYEPWAKSQDNLQISMAI